MKTKRPPALNSLLAQALVRADSRPLAFVLAGHNGSGKSTLWTQRIAPIVKVPLINADRLITSILPMQQEDGRLVPWAAKLRDNDERWQKLAQDGVSAFMGLVVERQMAFGFETVFSHWKRRSDGSYETKVDIIRSLQAEGYFVVLIFVGLANVDLSTMRVQTRVQQGGHAVDSKKLQERYPRTQKAIGVAAPIADMTIMFDNSLNMASGFNLTRVQEHDIVRYDCRDPVFAVSGDVRAPAALWLDKVVGPFVPA